jgi:hypothetical protein
VHVDDGDPMIAPPIPGWLHTGNTRQLDKPIWCHSHAETPPFRVAGLEISEFPAADRVHKKIAGLAIKGFDGARKSATEVLQLRDIHAHTSCHPTERVSRQGNAAEGPTAISHFAGWLGALRGIYLQCVDKRCNFDSRLTKGNRNGQSLDVGNDPDVNGQGHGEPRLP